MSGRVLRGDGSRPVSGTARVPEGRNNLAQRFSAGSPEHLGIFIPIVHFLFVDTILVVPVPTTQR